MYGKLLDRNRETASTICSSRNAKPSTGSVSGQLGFDPFDVEGDVVLVCRFS